MFNIVWVIVEIAKEAIQQSNRPKQTSITHGPGRELIKRQINLFVEHIMTHARPGSKMMDVSNPNNPDNPDNPEIFMFVIYS